MMKKYNAACMLGYWPISDRVIMMKIQGAPFNIIIQVYTPTSDHQDGEIEEFYCCIKEVMGYIRSGEAVIIMGDWNAKIGDEHQYPITGKYGIGERNERGNDLGDFCRTS